MKSSMTIFRDIFSNYKEWVLVVGILVVSFVVFFEQIHVPVFFPDVDEAIYAQSALESIQNKTPFIPIWYGDPFFDKPPLGYLIIQSGYKIFGENTFGARAGVAFTGVLAMIIFYYLGKEFFGRKLIAFFAVLALLATDSMYFHVFRSADFDGPLLLFFLLALWMYIKSWKSSKYFVLVGVFFALAVLTKGAAAFPAILILGIHWIFLKGWKVIPLKYILSSVLLFLGITVPWHWWMFSLYGQEFWNVYIGHHVVARVGENIGFSENSSPFWYLSQMSQYFWPWIWALPVVVYFVVKNFKFNDKLGRWILIALWALGFVGIYSVAQTRLFWYIAPVYPLLALALVATAVKTWSQKSWHRGEVFALSATALIMMWAAPWWKTGWIGSLNSTGLLEILLHPFVIGTLIWGAVSLVLYLIVNKSSDSERQKNQGRLWLLFFTMLLGGLLVSRLFQLTVMYPYESSSPFFDAIKNNAKVIVVSKPAYEQSHALYYYVNKFPKEIVVFVDAVEELGGFKNDFCFFDVASDSLEKLPQDTEPYYFEGVGPYYAACWYIEEDVETEETEEKNE